MVLQVVQVTLLKTTTTTTKKAAAIAQRNSTINQASTRFLHTD